MRGAHDNGSHGSKCLMGLRPGKRRDCGNGAESWEWAWAIAGTTCRSPLPRSLPGSARCIDCFNRNPIALAKSSRRLEFVKYVESQGAIFVAIHLTTEEWTVFQSGILYTFNFCSSNLFVRYEKASLETVAGSGILSC